LPTRFLVDAQALDSITIQLYTVVVGVQTINGVLSMELTLYYSSTTKPFDDQRNDGFGDVFGLLKQLEKQGISCEVIDTSYLTAEQMGEAYIHSVVGPTQLKKYRVRQVFGSARHSGWLFGKQVPALVVFSSESKVPEDVYPHDELGHIVTIKECLESLLAQLQ